MNILKPSVSLPRRSYRNLFAFALVGFVCYMLGGVLGVTVGYTQGYALGARDAGAPTGFQAETQDSVCGITDPVACMTSALESVADMFRPEMPVVMTVVYTPTVVEAPNCGLIMDTFHKMPRERLLEMPGLLEQVEECKAYYRSSSID